MKHPLILTVAVLALGLTGCSSDPETRLRGDTEDVIGAANDGDAGALRGAAQELLSTIKELGATGQLPAARETDLIALTLAVLEDAGQLEAEPTPSPAPTTPAPSRSPSPSPSPSPSRPSPSPSPSPSPEDDDEEDSPSPEPTKKGKQSTTPSQRGPIVEVPLSPS